MLSTLLRVPAYLLLVRFGGLLLAGVVAAVDVALFVWRCCSMSDSTVNNLTVLDDEAQGGLKDRFRQIIASSGQYHVHHAKHKIEVAPGQSVRAEIFVPTDRTGANRRVALVCTHPWRVMGGDMNNNVPAFLASTFARLGYITAKFNFRGGTFSRGTAEIEDVKAVCRHLQQLQNPPESIILVGYSYGSMISNASVDTLDCIKGFVGISTCGAR